MSEKRSSVGLGVLLLLASLLVGCGGNNSEEISPTASFTASPTGGEPPLTVVFDASGSSAAGGSEIVNYDWDFDDGTTGMGITVTHRFDTPGSYNVRLEVTDSRGNRASTEKSISVYGSGSLPGMLISSLQFSLRGQVPYKDLGLIDIEIVYRGRKLDAASPMECDQRVEYILSDFLGLGDLLFHVHMYNSSKGALYAMDAFNAPGRWLRYSTETKEEDMTLWVEAHYILASRIHEVILQYGTGDQSWTGEVDGVLTTWTLSNILVDASIPDSQFLPPPGEPVEDAG